RDLDVHARRERRLDRANLHDSRCEEARQDVVAVGADDELDDRQTHGARRVGRIDVAEIARRHGKGERALGRSQRNRSPYVIRDLRHDARPVDRVDGREPVRLAEALVVEHALHQVLAIVEAAFDRDVPQLGASTVVIWRRCTSEMRPWGWRMKMSMAWRPLQASIAAEPVSPEVAPTMVTR